MSFVLIDAETWDRSMLKCYEALAWFQGPSQHLVQLHSLKSLINEDAIFVACVQVTCFGQGGT